MSNQSEAEERGYVEDIRLAQEIDQHVAHATIKIGDIQIRGVKIWRTKNGRLYTHWPSFKEGYRWEDVIEMPADLRADIEADVISAYKVRKKEEKASGDKT